MSEILTIEKLERLPLSRFGNPRFKVTFTSGRTAQTEPDSSVNYDLENSDFQNVPLEVTFSPSGRITHAKIVKGKQ